MPSGKISYAIYQRLITLTLALLAGRHYASLVDLVVACALALPAGRKVGLMQLLEVRVGR